jgi:hypothetical protein
LDHAPAHPRLGARTAYRLQRIMMSRCVWVEAYERAESQGRVSDLCRLQRPIDHRRWESSWLNYWQGRDDDLWTDDDGLGAQPRLTVTPRLRPVPVAKPGRELVGA